MSESPSEDPIATDRRQRAVMAFVRHFERSEAGEDVDFEVLCCDHPDLAPELRALQRDMRRYWGAVLGELGVPSIADRMVALDASSSPATEFVDEVVRRLAGREGAFGRYHAKGRLGAGGMGEVRRVWDEDLRRHLAMKVVRAVEQADEPVASRHVARFVEEAQVTGQLEHPNIVPIYDLGLGDGGRVYYTMRLVEGRTLEDMIALAFRGEEGWSRTRVLEVVLKVCDAMAYAHSKGVVHRDLKPANVMVGRFGEVYVVDWGLARPMDRSTGAGDWPAGDGDASHSQVVVDSPRLTEEGTVVGTPAYMSPEQAGGELPAPSPRSDVYAVGAILYHVLSGHMPYVEPGTRPSGFEVWTRVRRGPPRSLHRSTRGVPAELVSICEKAMAREVGERYPTMEAVAEDLRAYLEGRVVRAYETGAWAEAKKWVRRNSALAGSLAGAVLVLVAGLVIALFLRQRAADNLVRAKRHEHEARIQENEARRGRDGVLRLSAFLRLAELTRRADEDLWPPHPDHLEAFDRWLEDANDLVAGLQPDPEADDIGHRARLAALKGTALPKTDAERAEDARQHPRYAELESLGAKLDVLRRAQQVREGEAEPLLFEDEDALPLDAEEASRRAWLLAGPDRTTFGREAEGLACALRAIDLAGASAARLSALAWAYFANGLDGDATRTIQNAIQAAGRDRNETKACEKHGGRLFAAVEGVADCRGVELLARVADEIADLEEEIDEATFEFVDVEQRWWHGRLVELIRAIETFADPDTGLIRGISPEHGWGVERRKAWAKNVVERTVEGAEVAEEWRRAIERIGASSRYGRLSIRPQVGLVPLGPDPVTGLEEFGHPLTGGLPRRRANGELVLTDGMGLVFVLIPPVRFWMGAQSADSSGPNFDDSPALEVEGPVHRVSLSPFFLSKFEMTQGQWMRIAGENPSQYHPGNLYHVSTLLNPVERVSWIDCLEMVERLGLALPTEAQWEAAARAGSDTPWWTGRLRESLAGALNIADRAAREWDAPWPEIEDWPNLDDGFACHAPVGTYRPNPFGLHDVHGNVTEWCLDRAVRYPVHPCVDPCEMVGNGNVVVRGGSYTDKAADTRSSCRNATARDHAVSFIGLRPARPIRE